MNYLIIGICAFSVLAVIIGIAAKKNHVNGYNPTRILILSLPILVLLWIFSVLLAKKNSKERDKDISGKIVSIDSAIRTSYVVDDGTTHYTNYLLKGLAVQDSVHHYANSGSVEYFKKDSLGIYKEILWIQNDDHIYEWHFK